MVRQSSLQPSRKEYTHFIRHLAVRSNKSFSDQTTPWVLALQPQPDQQPRWHSYNFGVVSAYLSPPAPRQFPALCANGSAKKAYLSPPAPREFPALCANGSAKKSLSLATCTQRVSHGSAKKAYPSPLVPREFLALCANGSAKKKPIPRHLYPESSQLCVLTAQPKKPRLAYGSVTAFSQPVKFKRHSMISGLQLALMIRSTNLTELWPYQEHDG